MDHGIKFLEVKNHLNLMLQLIQAKVQVLQQTQVQKNHLSLIQLNGF